MVHTRHIIVASDKACGGVSGTGYRSAVLCGGTE